MAEINLRRKFRWGALFGWLGWGLAILGSLGTIFLWLLFGPAGLAGSLLLYDVTVFVAVYGLRNQFDSLHLALQGVKDASDFAAQIRRGVDPEGELQRLRGRLALIEKEMSELRGQWNIRTEDR